MNSKVMSFWTRVIPMSTPFENTYDLSSEQLENLDLAEDLMLKKVQQKSYF
jgi:hypothetical protein